MKGFPPLLTCVALLWINGCAATGEVILDDTKRVPTTSVDIYKGGKMPDRRFKEIAELSFLGPREDELRAQRRFLGQARKMGGNGLIFYAEDAGRRGGLTVFQITKYVFKGKVIVYE